ncbi:MAG: HAMP domain-containing histidine kinase, partial [Candidatus Dadabacteria bacterium]
MGRPPLVRQIYLPFLGLVLATLAVATFMATLSVRRAYLEQTRLALELAARSLAATRGGQSPTGHEAEIQSQVSRAAHGADMRITVIAPDGTVIADSDEDPRVMDNHADRPEVREALARGIGRATRFSHTVKREMFYVALAVRGDDGRPAGVVRTSIPLAHIEGRLRTLYGTAIASAAALALLAAAVAWMVSRRISSPLEHLEKSAQAVRSGGPAHFAVSPRASREIEQLGRSLEAMAAELDRRVRSIAAERDQREAVLASMVEGVLAVDSSRRLVTVNKAAAALLGCSVDDALGLPLEQARRLPALQRFVERVFHSTEPLEEEIVTGELPRRFLQAHGSAVRDAAGQVRLAVVVLNDVTDLRRLETVRREFVANVSHELKTPITSVKGFLDTLRDGAVDDPQSARRFVEIAARQAERLGMIIDDLLALSRLEEVSERQTIERRSQPLRPILEGAIEVCRHKADSKNIRIILGCPADLEAPLDPALAEQAVVNLIDNAVKYSGENSAVRVCAERCGDTVRIDVHDQGPGIDAAHLPRLF